MFDGFGLVVTQIAVVAGAAALFGLVLGWILGGGRERRRAERAAARKSAAETLTAPPAAPAPTEAPVTPAKVVPPEPSVVVPFGGRRYVD